MAAFYDQLDKPDEEIEQAKKVVETDPNFAYGYFYLGLGYEGKGMNREAVEAFAQTMTLFGEPIDCAAEVREAFTKNGIEGFWRKRLEQIETRPHLKNFQAYSKVLVQIRLGDKKAALESLNQAFERRDRWMIHAKYEPRLASLRQDSRFQELLQRMKL